MEDMGVTEDLIHKCHEQAFAALSDDDIDRTKYLLLDYLGVTARGSLSDSGRFVQNLVTQLDAGGSGAVVIGTDIRWIHDATRGLHRNVIPVYKSAVYPLVYILPLAIALLSLWIRRQQDRLEGDVEGRRKRRAAKRALAALKEAQQNYDENKISEGFTALARGVINYLADRTNNIASTLDTTTIDTILTYRNVPEEKKKQLQNILEKCNTARFTPGGLNPKVLSNLIRISRNWIQDTDRYLGN